MAVHDNPADRARWTKGGGSPNPGGQTKAQAEARKLAAEFIRSETDGGRDILRFALATMRGERVEIAGKDVAPPDDSKSRCWAAGFLADRLWGKSTVLVETTETEGARMPDMRGKTLAELRELAGRAPKPIAPPAQDGPDEPPGRVH
jgi:hypothetical protein